MEPADHARRRSSAVTAPGELIFENGKPAGARRALNCGATVIGRAAVCDIRLKGGGVEPLHCLLVHGPEGLQVRDFQTTAGTVVNGRRVASGPLHDGDTLKIGGYVFRLRLTGRARNPADGLSGEALRVQAAAVAAQQAALGEDEARLKQRLEALEQQEQQLSKHLEEKRRQLIKVGERAQEERAALANERAAHEQYVQRIGGDLSDAQREMLEQQQQIQVERRRLSVLRGRLYKRWRRQFAAEQERLALRAEELANENCNLKKESEALTNERTALAGERLAFNGQYELGRRQIQDASARLRHERQEWRRRRGQERTALHLQARELSDQQLSLTAAEQHLRNDAEAGQARRERLEKELDGLSQRVRNQRDRILEQQLEIHRLDAILRQRRTQATMPAAAASEAMAQPATSKSEEGGSVPAAPASVATLRSGDNSGKSRRVVDLDRLAGELADQRLQLGEQWQRLVQSQQRWEQDRARAAGELEALAHESQVQEQALCGREQACRTAEEELHKKHRELVQMRQHLVGWRARLRAREATWDGERKQVLAELNHREKFLDQHSSMLVDIRRRWARQRRLELEKLRSERAAAAGLRRECVQLRQEWQSRYAAVEEGKRILAEKTLALEQFRQEAFARSVDAPAAQGRVERLRRRWLSQNAAVLRTLSQERRTLKNELAELEARHSDLQKRAEELLDADLRQTDKHAEWEQLQTESATRLARMQQDLNIALAQRQGAEHELAKMREEVEQIARALLEEPEPPAVPMDRAA